MKQQGDTTQRIKQFTSDTILNLKVGLTEYCKEKQALFCSNKVTQCIDSFEALIFCLINDIGGQKTPIPQTTPSMEDIVQALKSQNQDLKDQLAGAQLLIQQKNFLIQWLSNANSTLAQNILTLQSQISNLINFNEEESQDSLQDINIDNLEVYESDSEEQESEEDEVSNFGTMQ